VDAKGTTAVIFLGAHEIPSAPHSTRSSIIVAGSGTAVTMSATDTIRQPKDRITIEHGTDLLSSILRVRGGAATCAISSEFKGLLDLRANLQTAAWSRSVISSEAWPTGWSRAHSGQVLPNVFGTNDDCPHEEAFSIPHLVQQLRLPARRGSNASMKGDKSKD
jgi:hypothetical protein